jgi:hypothetical protein
MHIYIYIHIYMHHFLTDDKTMTPFWSLGTGKAFNPEEYLSVYNVLYLWQKSSLCMYVCMYLFVCVHTRRALHVCVCVCVCVYIYIYMHVCMYVCIYIYIYIYMTHSRIVYLRGLLGHQKHLFGQDQWHKHVWVVLSVAQLCHETCRTTLKNVCVYGFVWVCMAY